MVKPRCEARAWYWPSKGAQCTQCATHQAGERSVCWVHWMAWKNTHRTTPLQFVVRPGNLLSVGDRSIE